MAGVVPHMKVGYMVTEERGNHPPPLASGKRVSERLSFIHHYREIVENNNHRLTILYIVRPERGGGCD